MLEDVFVDLAFGHSRIEYGDADVEQLSLGDLRRALLERNRVRDEHFGAGATCNEGQPGDERYRDAAHIGSPARLLARNDLLVLVVLVPE